MQRKYVAGLILLCVCLALSQDAHAQANPAKLPTKAEIDAAMQRTFGYDPSITWTIYDIRQSSIPGVMDLLLSINKGAPQHIYWSADTQNAVIGEMIPLGSNPFSPARTLLKAADGPALGSKTPVILLIEFSDLECPHCKAAQPVLEKLATDFPQVRYVFQQFPLPASLHPWARRAADYADCAGRMDSTAFWKYIDAIFETQDSITPNNADDKLRELAGRAGLDAEKLSACAAAAETEARVKKSLELGDALDVNQTPTLFVNGRRILGIETIPYDSLKRLVQFEIDHAGK